MRNLTLYVILFFLVTSCISTSPPVGKAVPDKMSVTPVTQLPVFAKQENEVEIADSMNDVDPTWVLGSIVNTKTGKVRSLDNYLARIAKPAVVPQTELVFKDFIENSIVLNAGWLDFLRTQVSDKVRAEVSVIKTSKVTVKNNDIDKAKLKKEIAKVPKEVLNDHGMIIGYIDFVVTAALFKDFGTDGNLSGYGAKIGGTWYSKFENTAAHHIVIAIWSPLPFVLGILEKSDTPIASSGKEKPTAISINMEDATRKAMELGTVKVKPLDTIRIGEDIIGEDIEVKESGKKRASDRLW